MVGELITLPLRVGVRVTQLSLRAAGGIAGAALDVVTRLYDDVRGRQVAEPVPAAAGEPPPSRPAMSVVTDKGEASPASGEEDEAVASPPRSAPAHVSQQPELVHEVAEPGAEEGVGPEVNVQEPWEGYERSSADEVITRLARATPAELAAVQLYESAHRARRTILAAVEHELQSKRQRLPDSREEPINA